MIKVLKEKPGQFLVTVENKGATTRHAVKLDDKYYQKLTAGKISREELIKKSFEFLLERESSTSILPEFNLKLITTYFPEYEEEISENPRA
jgi:hypothetical protein